MESDSRVHKRVPLRAPLALYGIIVLIFILGLRWYIARQNADSAYVTAPVTRGSIASTVEATGTINPVTTVQVGAQVSGKIVKLLVDYNSVVKKGQLIAQIDPTTYETDVAQAQADLWSAQSQAQNTQAQLQKDQANFENAQITYRRDQVLWQKNYIAHSDLDTAKAAYEAAKAQVEGDKTLIASAQSNEKNKTAVLAKAQTNLAYTRITSPVDGVVVARNVDVGQTVVSSFQAPNLFLIAKDLKSMQVETNVDEADVGKIRNGQTANFTVDAYPDETFQGRVQQIRKNPITQQNVVNYDVIILVSNPDFKLFPGMTADVSTIVAEHQNVLKIPNAALRFVPPQAQNQNPGKNAAQGNHGGFGSGLRGTSSHQHSGPAKQSKTNEKIVWVLKNKKAVPQFVELGLANDSETEVVSGLTENDQVIIDVSQKQTARKNPFSVF